MITLDKTQQILNAVGNISIDDFETVLTETLKEIDDELTAHDLVDSLKSYIDYFDDDILKVYNEEYESAKGDYEFAKEWFDEIKDDDDFSQDDVDDAAWDVNECKDDLDELRELPTSLIEMTQEDYDWLFEHLKNFDKPLSNETLEDVEIEDIFESDIDGDVLYAFLKLDDKDRQVVLNKKY